MKFNPNIKKWIKDVIIAILIVVGIQMFISPLTVYSISMNPTLVEGDVLVLLKHTTIERGDIISFYSELPYTEKEYASLNIFQKWMTKIHPNKSLIKRIIALPGDSIRIMQGQVFVNGELLIEPYLGSSTSGEVDIQSLPENKYFVMGDNRANSLDSRSEGVGLISKEDIMGKILVRVLPMNKLGKVK